MGDPVYQGAVFRVVVNKKTPEGWRLDGARWFTDSACQEEVLPTMEYMVNTDRTAAYGRRQSVSTLPYRAPCDDDTAFDACGCRQPYAGFNSTTDKCQLGSETDSRDEYYCAEKKIFAADQRDYGCPAGKTSYEAWFETWNTNVKCVKLRQSVSPAYRATELAIQQYNMTVERFQSALPHSSGILAMAPNGRERAIPFHAGCGDTYHLPNTTQPDVQLVLSSEKVSANLGMDAVGRRAVLFAAPVADGINLQLYCTGNEDSTVLSVTCKDGHWSEMQSSSRGCATPHFIPAGFNGEQIKHAYTPANDTSGADLLGILGAIFGIVGSLILGTFIWRVFFRSGAAQLDGELRAASPGSEDGLTYNMAYDNMMSAERSNAPALAGPKKAQAEPQGRYGSWDDFNTVPPRKMKSRDGARSTKINVTNTLNRVEEEMSRSMIGRRSDSGGSRSQSPAKRTARSDRTRSVDADVDESVRSSVSPPRKLRQRLNTAGEDKRGVDFEMDNTSEFSATQQSAPRQRGGYSYRTGSATRDTARMVQPPTSSKTTNSAERRGGGGDEQKSKTQQLLESWDGGNADRPSSAALKALRAKTDRILNSANRPAGASFMEKSAETLMRKSPERERAGGHSRSAASTRPQQRPVAGSGSYRAASASATTYSSGTAPTRGEHVSIPLAPRTLSGSGAGPVSSGLNQPGATFQHPRSGSIPRSSASSSAGASASSSMVRPPGGFTQPHEQQEPGYHSSRARSGSGQRAAEPVNDYYRMKSAGRGGPTGPPRPGSQSPAGQGSLDRFGHAAPGHGRIPNRDRFNR
ncbi:unnamed protein product [Amoebophrya sp. A120]|nr:unnamed protein product [Amoebophrya sp. A120]|eukprot:GSA120T00005438001.1